MDPTISAPHYLSGVGDCEMMVIIDTASLSPTVIVENFAAGYADPERSVRFRVFFLS